MVDRRRSAHCALASARIARASPCGAHLGEPCEGTRRVPVFVAAATPAADALAQDTSASSPGAATKSPVSHTPSPRSIAGRSAHVDPGGSSAPLSHSTTARRRAPADDLA